jgi:UDP-N-acetylmuramyl pentapeptide phosphotransferase/UDP-N-acetylglucosamine-1-phosphate transferase
MPGHVLAVATAAIAAISLRDDYRAVPAWTRLAIHGVASVAVALALLSPAGMPPWMAVLASAVMLAWAANLYNFMDGSDGLAATVALCGFAAYAAAALAAGASAVPYACVVAATLPLLWVNRPPARMFLGDVGALPLGFLAGALGLGGVVAGAWPAWLPLLAFLPFLVDATLTLCARAWRGERVWEAHRSHYYQRFHQMGASHRGTLAASAALSAGTAGTAVACTWLAPRAGWVALGAWLAVHAVLCAAIDYHWRRFHPHP